MWKEKSGRWKCCLPTTEVKYLLRTGHSFLRELWMKRLESRYKIHLVCISLLHCSKIGKVCTESGKIYWVTNFRDQHGISVSCFLFFGAEGWDLASGMGFLCSDFFNYCLCNVSKRSEHQCFFSFPLHLPFLIRIYFNNHTWLHSSKNVPLFLSEILHLVCKVVFNLQIGLQTYR